MASHKVLLITAAATAVVMGALLRSTAAGVSYDVGDGDGWGLKVDYADWVKGNGFEVGDTLVFVYTKGKHNVVAVDEDGYKNCDPSGGEELTTENDSVYLDTAKTYYFICGMDDHCKRGMRLKVEVYAAPDD